MGDNDIVKALECCSTGKSSDCEDCPFKKRCYDEGKEILEEAIALIKRQQAEIERLQGYNENLLTANTDMVLGLVDEMKKARAEAIKEFSKKLNAEMFYKCGDMNYTETCEARRLIDNLVKEMTEEEK